MTKLNTLKALAIATVATLVGLGAAPQSSNAMNLAAPTVESTAASGAVEQVGFRGRRGGFRRFGGFRRGGFRRFRHHGFRHYRVRRHYGHSRRWARRAHCLELQARGYRIYCH
jgi:hypothetical protein